MDWTLEDNMVDGLFFCATLTGRRGGHPPVVQAGAETSGTSVVAVKPRVANRSGMDGTVPELTSGVPCPRLGHFFPGSY